MLHNAYTDSTQVHDDIMLQYASDYDAHLLSSLEEVDEHFCLPQYIHDGWS